MSLFSCTFDAHGIIVGIDTVDPIRIDNFESTLNDNFTRCPVIVPTNEKLRINNKLIVRDFLEFPAADHVIKVRRS